MSAPAVAVPAPVAVAAAEKRAQVEQLLAEIFRLAEWPARLELREGSDGSIAVAVHFDGEVPGVTPGKKSYVVDSLQFLVNKVVNRPGVEKRWVTLGVGAFPEPKAAAPAPQPSAPKALKPPRASMPPAPKASMRAEEPEVAVAPEWARVGQLLSAKAVKHGRQYAVMSLTGSERAQVAKAGAAAGVRVKVEGDGHFARVAFTPDKPVPMPRKLQFPDDDEDDDEG